MDSLHIPQADNIRSLTVSYVDDLPDF